MRPIGCHDFVGESALISLNDESGWYTLKKEAVLILSTLIGLCLIKMIRLLAILLQWNLLYLSLETNTHSI